MHSRINVCACFPRDFQLVYVVQYSKDARSYLLAAGAVTTSVRRFYNTSDPAAKGGANCRDNRRDRYCTSEGNRSAD